MGQSGISLEIYCNGKYIFYNVLTPSFQENPMKSDSDIKEAIESEGNELEIC